MGCGFDCDVDVLWEDVSGGMLEMRPVKREQRLYCLSHTISAAVLMVLPHGIKASSEISTLLPEQRSCDNDSVARSALLELFISLI